MTHFEGDKKTEYEINYGVNTYFKFKEKVTVACQTNDTFISLQIFSLT